MSLIEKIASAPARSADRLDTRAVLILIACCACWGVNQAAIKIASEGISPILRAGARSLLSGMLVFAWSAARGIRLFERGGTLWPGIVCGALFGLEFVILHVGLGLRRHRVAWSSFTCRPSWWHSAHTTSSLAIA